MDAYRCAARLVVLKIFCVYLVVGLEVAFHIYQEYGHIYQLIPAAATLFQYGAHIVKYAATLLREIKLKVVAMLICLQAGYLVGAGLAWPYP